MKSDIMKLDGNLASTEDTLDEVEKLASFFGFDTRDSAFARLLAEEGINAFSTLIGINHGSLWVETVEKNFEIHLTVNAQLNSDNRENLINLSKSKKNTPRKGIIGKIASFIDYVASDMAIGENPFVFSDMADEMVSYAGMMASPDMVFWSLQKEQKKIAEKNELTDIERSIIERFADDIFVSIALKNIELTIKKTKK